MGTIFQCLQVDISYQPIQRKLAHSAKTEKEAIEWLQQHGGGIYRNILHNFECRIDALKEEG